MSADNWGICPQCNKNNSKKRKAAYGKVSEDEYLALLELDENTEGKRTLREDYEIFTDEDGVFHIRYSGSCSVCTFHFEYDYEKNVLK